MDGGENRNEMEQIQKGLEAFLKNEIKQMEAGGRESEKQTQDSVAAAPGIRRQNYAEENDAAEGDGIKMINITPESSRAEADSLEEEWEAEDWDLDIGGRAAPIRRQSGRTASGAGGSRLPRDSRPQGSTPDGLREKGYGSRNQNKSNDRRKNNKNIADKKIGGKKPDKENAAELTTQKSNKKKKKKKSRLKSALCRLLVATVLIIGLLGFGIYQLVGYAYGKMHYQEIEALADAPMKEDGVVNILLIGNDSRDNGEDGRSDAMILLSVSSRTKSIYMTSLLRDIYVEIPGYKGNRLNAAYAFGGAELLMETIEKNFDISVNRYVLVNFEAFAGLVDAVGGIELELTSQEIEYVNGYLVEYNILTHRPQGTDNMDASVSGLVHLNGPQALAYSRNRYLGTDFGRTERQRKVLTAVIGKLPGALLTNAGGLLDGLMPNLTTNLTKQECFRLSLMAGKLLTYDIVSDSIPRPGTYQNATIREMSVLQVDFDANIAYLKEKIYGEQD